MKSAGSGLIAHLAQPHTTLAALCKITRRDGVVLGFTAHDQPLVVEGVPYQPQGGLTPGRLEARSDFGSGSFSLSGILDSSAITEEDLRAGLYDQARVDFFLCNWADVGQGVIAMDRGFLAQVTVRDGQYVAEIVGFQDVMQRERGQFYTAECRHDLGDAQCTVNLAAVTVTGTVTGVVDAVRFTDSARSEGNDHFQYGKLTFTSGANAGQSVEVKAWALDSRQFTLWLPPLHPLAVGDTYSVHAGCSKRAEICKTRFNNFANFGGFPHMPGVDAILATPDARG